MVLAHSPPRKAANTRPPDRNLPRIPETPADIITQQSPSPQPSTSRAGRSHSLSPRASSRLASIRESSPSQDLRTPPPSPSRGRISLSPPPSSQASPSHTYSTFIVFTPPPKFHPLRHPSHSSYPHPSHPSHPSHPPHPSHPQHPPHPPQPRILTSKLLYPTS
ncbi:WAS/WASL-interacting protein family member 1-like [Plodia interpunctella]|uniref:WAS/WASL-interacting protein family member 1-like n=1 Tax=Plodia interpunctella TaxID=58824 RepID=UPI002368A347|nr:WAS/WASL-interacting protein family member 1-like [Plodia interpunctella]